MKFSGGIRGAFGRGSLLAAAFALLMQILAWSWMPAALVPTNALAEAGGGIIICTAEGLAILAPDGSKTLIGDSGADENGKAPAGRSCQLCPMVAGLSLPPPNTGHVPAFHGCGTHIVDFNPQITPGAFRATALARAPPAV
ncbi:DUF2946 family protein [Ferrovibrio sp.]|uniref:DUF2946 family protein n=1 Tax=Ferrovibrio sp. TaxID=1917215 RepID=UPI0025C3CFE1|nr:DUF2946 family protein [Ferrovibrio sp.]MBX3456635.1 hypothetical protein [Ferrovibrio sp.]